ncbi:ABC transporter permease [Amycolatopsis granulosa]|uniref:ABC transporter permease n=1 Tax=Amycolatopsis granulosa TaxID=185684 RepID=UPI00312C7957|nr:ABC-2 type transport system permease protein [Amycolatopsis granulosa]
MDDPRSWSRAREDLRRGFRSWRLWGHLGWNDIRSRYRRSLLGPFWMTVTMGVTTAGLGSVFSLIWHSPAATFFPYVGTGLIVWAFIGGCLSDGMGSFTESAELLSQTSAPLTVYVLRTVWRQTLILAHNLIIYFVLLAFFFRRLHEHGYTMDGQACGTPDGMVCHPGLGWNTFLVLPGFGLALAGGIAAALILGIVATRFRDAPPLIGAIIQLLFILVPITWPLDKLIQNAPGKAWIIELNPLYHYVQIVRQPLIGQQLHWWSWLVAGGLTLAAWTVALVMLRNYRARVPYWI